MRSSLAVVGATVFGSAARIASVAACALLVVFLLVEDDAFCALLLLRCFLERPIVVII